MGTREVAALVGACLLAGFPQAFTHVGLVNSALNLDRGLGPANRRRRA